MNDSVALPLIWNIPYRQNPFFTGREELLNRLHDSLHAENTATLTQPQGISGLGGIGKTQTALEYAYRYGANYDAVFWVQADSATALISGYVTLAHLLRLPERDEQDQRVIVEATLRWLRVHAGWLLVFDSMDDPSVVEPFLPKAGRGHILFTTRAHAFGGIAPRLEVPQMEPETGALLLLRRASILPVQALLDAATSNDRSVACDISQELDGLPLALDQAGAYIKETPCVLMDYLARYRTRRQELLQARGSLYLDYPASVATTWSLSFEKVCQTSPAAEELLNFCAFLAPEAIPEEILISGASHLGPILSPVVANPLQFDQVCKEVLRYSLFQRQADARTLTIHRLVQAVLKDAMSEKVQDEWAQRTIYAVNATFPSVDFTLWQQCERCLPHALACAELIDQGNLTLLEAASLLYRIGWYLDDRGRYSQAASLDERAFSIYEQRLGPEHLDTASSLNNLAGVYKNQGKHEQAEPLLLRALSIREQQLGPEHLDIANSCNNLAELYRVQGKYEQAESLYQRALSIHEQQLGPEHLNTATTLHNLALLYHHQGKYERSEPLLTQALSVYEQRLGPEHPDTAQGINNLAMLYLAQKKYEQAEPLLLRTLSIREQQLGPEHPDTASSLSDLALVYYRHGKYEQAEPLWERALQIREQQLGADHLDTALSLHNLATLYRDQGKGESAELLFQRTLAIKEQHLGPEHLDTALSLNNLAKLYQNQGKDAEAEHLYQRALVIFERDLGREHPRTQTARKNCAVLLRAMGYEEEAVQLEEHL